MFQHILGSREGNESCSGGGNDGDNCDILGIPIFYTYLITPRSRVLLEKLTGSAASQEIPLIFGTRRFLTVLTSARHLSIS